MSEKEFMKTLWNNIQKYLDMYGMSQMEFAKRIGVSPAAIVGWKKGTKQPRMDKIDKMCELFNCRRSDLMEEHDSENYYIDSEARNYAEFLHSNPEYRILFNACRNIKKEDLEFVKEMIDRMAKD